MSDQPTYNVTLLQFMTSLANNLRNNAGQTNTLGSGPSQNILNFLVSWGHWEGGSQTNKATFNPLNTMQQEEGSTQASGDILKGIQAYPDSTTGVKATVDALNNGNYPSLVHALETNDELNLGFTQRSSPLFNHMMANNIAGDLSTWVSGNRTLTSSSQSYILNIMQGAGIPNASIDGGNRESSLAGNSQDTINKWGNVSLGMSQQGTVASNVQGQWTTNDIIKVALGALFILIGAVLFIKAQFPGSTIGKVAKKAIPFL